MLLLEQYPNVPDVSEDELLSTVNDVLALQSEKSGALPSALIILDELQQFLDDNPTETQPVIDLVEACSARFGSALLFLGTGQSALRASPLLGKLQDRFTVRVHLTDTDIETVVRSVVLRKRADKETELRDVLESVSGEISSPPSRKHHLLRRRSMPRPHAGLSGASFATAFLAIRGNVYVFAHFGGVALHMLAML